MMRCCVLLLVAACGPDNSEPRKPSGTPTDPVEVCERVGDVCRIDKAKLGVCTQRVDRTFACASQH